VYSDKLKLKQEWIIIRVIIKNYYKTEMNIGSLETDLVRRGAKQLDHRGRGHSYKSQPSLGSPSKIKSWRILCSSFPYGFPAVNSCPSPLFATKKRHFFLESPTRLVVDLLLRLERLDWFQISADAWSWRVSGCLMFVFERRRGGGCGARVRLLLAQRFISIYTMFFRTGSVRSGLTGLCITKPKTEPNRDFF